MIKPNNEQKADYDMNTFCAHCPDADKMPAGCDLSCGWPKRIDAKPSRACNYLEQCPCARPCSGERAQAMCEWLREGGQRAHEISAMFGPQDVGEDAERETEMHVWKSKMNVVVLG
jgi:hypothetical protein